MLKDLENMALLYDFYGSLLTPRQQELIQAYFLEDLSLAEIAGEGGVSRQAVHDLIKRAEGALTEYEEKLGFLREYRQRQEILTKLESALQQGDTQTALTLVAALQSE